MAETVEEIDYHDVACVRGSPPARCLASRRVEWEGKTGLSFKDPQAYCRSYSTGGT